MSESPPPRPPARPTVQIDNGRVRVTEWRFAPGAATGWHRHAFDHVVVPLTTGPLRIRSATGEVTAELTAGHAYFRGLGVEHDVANPGAHPFAFVEIELRPALTLGPYEGSWPPDDPDAGFRGLVAEYSRIDPLPTLETLGRTKAIPVGALARFVLARYAASGSDALLEMGPRVVRQMDDLVRRAEATGTDAARLEAYRALAAVVSWLKAPLDDRPGPDRSGPGESGRPPDGRPIG